jgi:hypothetical protein
MCHIKINLIGARKLSLGGTLRTSEHLEDVILSRLKTSIL